MPPPYARHVFVCTNRRPDGSPKGCCATKGAEALKEKLKLAAKARGLPGVRVNAAGCLDACEHGVSVVVYPEGTWYAGVTVGDIDEIVEQHLARGQPVQRLLMPKTPERKPGA